MNPYSLLGAQLLALAFPTALYSLLMYLIGFYQRHPRLIYSAQRANVLTFGLMSASVLVLVTAFICNRFDILYVAGYSNKTLPLFYKITGLWAGLDGSILFWTWLMSLYVFIVCRQNRKKNADWMPVINGAMMSVILFFLALMIFSNNPFTPNPQVVLDGKGLNPLLQNIAMVVHPPCLYLGFTGFSVPFAFALAALVSRRVDMNWIEDSRRWTIIAWGFLTLGLILGGAWAYVELGWGGFWAWDPVENAGLMPWLTASAYLHSVVTQKKRGMLALWNVCLIMLTFLLTIFGTYLTRSGIVQSVHAFSESNLGPYFLGFMGLLIVACFYFVVSRLDLLKNENILHSFVSKEAAFLLNNIILLVACLAIFWGTLFPTLSEWVTGERVSVGIPFFNRIMAPIGLVLLFLMALGPMISWKRATVQNLKQNLLIPFGLGFFAMCLAFLWVRPWYVLGSVFFIVATFSTIVLEFVRGVKALRIQNKGSAYLTCFMELFVKANRRYGGYVIHLGILLIFMGIAGTVFQTQQDFVLAPGEQKSFSGYELLYVKPILNETAHRSEFVAELEVTRNGTHQARLKPAKYFYKTSEQPTTEVALHQTIFWDLYLIIGNYDPETNRADFRASLNPLISFVWLGGFVILLGVGIILLPRGLHLKTMGPVLLLALTLLNPIEVRAEHVHDSMAGGDPFQEIQGNPAELTQLKSISDQIICQCGGCVRMSLASCTCEFAKKERRVLMDFIQQGKSPAEIIQTFTQKYGLPVLNSPPTRGFFRVGYWFPVVLLLGSLGGGIFFIARRSPALGLVAHDYIPPVLDEQDPYVKRIKQEMEQKS